MKKVQIVGYIHTNNSEKVQTVGYINTNNSEKVQKGWLYKHK